MRPLWNRDKVFLIGDVLAKIGAATIMQMADACEAQFEEGIYGSGPLYHNSDWCEGLFADREELEAAISEILELTLVTRSV